MIGCQGYSDEPHRPADRALAIEGEIGIIELAPTHADLAAQVGSHREEVTREMSFLRRRSLVKKPVAGCWST